MSDLTSTEKLSPLPLPPLSSREAPRSLNPSKLTAGDSLSLVRMGTAGVMEGAGQGELFLLPKTSSHRTEPFPFTQQRFPRIVLDPAASCDSAIDSQTGGCNFFSPPEERGTSSRSLLDFRSERRTSSK